MESCKQIAARGQRQMLKKMWYVYTVYEEKSFSKAAKRLFVS